MLRRKAALLIDAGINLILAAILMLFSDDLADFLGLPAVKSNFYPNILGAVFFGITVALILEAFRNQAKNSIIGLGMMGAICINLCGGIALFIWLVFGNLSLPLRGFIILWTLDVILLVISSIEVFNILKKS